MVPHRGTLLRAGRRVVRAGRYGAAVQFLPLVLSAVAALAVAPGLRAALIAGGHTVENYRGRAIACPLGIVLVVAVALTIGAVQTLDELGIYEPKAFATSPEFLLGVAALGLFDDAYSGPSRGWRGHGRAVAKGGLPTGAIKAIGTLGLAAYVAGGYVEFGGVAIEDKFLNFVLIVLILSLATNLFNIVDLRPGRAVKLYALVFIGCLIGIGSSGRSDLFEASGAYLGAILVVGLYDLRERGMLGDTGANMIGAAAGLLLVITITSTTGRVVTAVVLLAINVFGEFRSISGVIDRTPGLRHLDSVGRISSRD